MEVWAIVTLVLAAVLVGVTIPVLIQLYSTLRTAEKALRELGPKLDATLDEMRGAAQRLNHVGGEFERGAGKAKLLFDALGDIGRSVHRVRSSIATASHLGTAVGPAVAAAVRAVASARADKQARHPHGQDGDRPPGAPKRSRRSTQSPPADKEAPHER